MIQYVPWVDLRLWVVHLVVRHAGASLCLTSIRDLAPVLSLGEGTWLNQAVSKGDLTICQPCLEGMAR